MQGDRFSRLQGERDHHAPAALGLRRLCFLARWFRRLTLRFGAGLLGVGVGLLRLRIPPVCLLDFLGLLLWALFGAPFFLDEGSSPHVVERLMQLVNYCCDAHTILSRQHFKRANQFDREVHHGFLP